VGLLWKISLCWVNGLCNDCFSAVCIVSNGNDGRAADEYGRKGPWLLNATVRVKLAGRSKKYGYVRRACHGKAANSVNYLLGL
jgi:hypothetical protein